MCVCVCVCVCVCKVGMWRVNVSGPGVSVLEFKQTIAAEHNIEEDMFELSTVSGL